MLPGYFGSLRYPVTMDLRRPISSRGRTTGLGTHSANLFADLDNGHYFSAS